MKEAADILAQSPYAMQLRYLQTLNGIATEQNSTIVFPLPIDLLSIFPKSPKNSTETVNKLLTSVSTPKTESSPKKTTHISFHLPTSTDI